VNLPPACIGGLNEEKIGKEVLEMDEEYMGVGGNGNMGHMGPNDDWEEDVNDGKIGLAKSGWFGQ
jgi:hypothetical protein